MVIQTLALLGLLAQSAAAAPAPVAVESVSVSPAHPDPGQMVTIRATLLNRVIRKWDNFDYMFAAQLLPKKGKDILMESRSLPLTVHPNTGETGELILKGVLMPPDAAGTYFIRIVVRDGSEDVTFSKRLSLLIGKEPPPKVVTRVAVSTAVAVSTVPVIEAPNFTTSTGPFLSIQLSETGQLRLLGTRKYLEGDLDSRVQLMAEAVKAWRENRPTGTPDNVPPLAAVIWPSGGELWDAYGVRRLDAWEDGAAQAKAVSGRWFGSMGGQLSTAGSDKGSYFNARIGSTLYKERYDLAAVLGSSPAGTNFGLSGRALFRTGNRLGFNAGLEILGLPAGKPRQVISLLLGFSYFVPSGSFDLGLSAGTGGTMSLSAGYTVYVLR